MSLRMGYTVLPMLLVLCGAFACGGGDGDNGATGGAFAGGGSSAAMGGGGSGGQVSGGASGSGGASTGGAPLGGASSGGANGGGSRSVTGVRCFDGNDTAFEYCFGMLGDVVVMVNPPCWPQALEDSGSYTALSGGPYENGCPGMSDDLSAWDEVRCWSAQNIETPICLFRLGDYWLEGFAPCNGVFDGGGLTPNDLTDPGTASCGTPSGTSGWDEIRCYDYLDSALCYGRIGRYWFGPTLQTLWLSSLYGACQLDTFAADATWTEIPVSAADCQ